MAVQGNNLTGLDVSQEPGTHDIEGAGFAAHHKTFSQGADAQRLDAVFVPAGIDAVGGHDHKGEAAFHHVEGLDDVHDTVLAGVLFHQVGQQLAVGSRLEDGAAFFQVVGNLAGIHHVAVGRHREVAAAVMEEQGLHVVQSAFGGVGIFDAADSQRAGQVGQLPVGENLAQEPQSAVAAVFPVVVEGGYPAAFLAAVLQVVQTVINVRGGVGDAIYCKDSHYCIDSSFSSTLA